MVGVAQQVELLVVVQAVAGSSPVAHPQKRLDLRQETRRRSPAASVCSARLRSTEQPDQPPGKSKQRLTERHPATEAEPLQRAHGLGRKAIQVGGQSEEDLGRCQGVAVRLVRAVNRQPKRLRQRRKT